MNGPTLARLRPLSRPCSPPLTCARCRRLTVSLDLQGLLAAMAVMVAAPFIGRLLAGRVPTVALQMLGGILVGPAGLAWLVPSYEYSSL